MTELEKYKAVITWWNNILLESFPVPSIPPKRVSVNLYRSIPCNPPKFVAEAIRLVNDLEKLQ